MYAVCMVVYIYGIGMQGSIFFMDFLFTLLSFLGGLKYWTYYIAGLVWEGRWKIRLSFKAIEKDRKKEEHVKSSRWFFVRFLDNFKKKG